MRLRSVFLLCAFVAPGLLAAQRALPAGPRATLAPPIAPYRASMTLQPRLAWRSMSAPTATRKRARRGPYLLCGALIGAGVGTGIALARARASTEEFAYAAVPVATVACGALGLFGGAWIYSVIHER